MKAKNVIIILIIFVAVTCVFPFAVAIAGVVIKNVAGESVRDLVGMLFLSVLCAVPLLLAFGGLIWQVQHIFRSRSAGRRLAGALGLTPLNQTPKEMGIWYGGEYQGRRFAIKPIGTTYRYYAVDRSRTGVSFLLRIALELRLDEPLGVVVYRGLRPSSRNPGNFEEAFDLENAGRLSIEAREAMFAFVQQGYRSGMTGVTFRLSKGTRNLRLSDRASAPEGLLAPEVLADAAAILAHDHPDTTISAEALRALLDEMSAVASAIERSG